MKWLFFAIALAYGDTCVQVGKPESGRIEVIAKDATGATLRNPRVELFEVGTRLSVDPTRPIRRVRSAGRGPWVQIAPSRVAFVPTYPHSQSRAVHRIWMWLSAKHPREIKRSTPRTRNMDESCARLGNRRGRISRRCEWGLSHLGTRVWNLHTDRHGWQRSHSYRDGVHKSQQSCHD